MKIFFNEFIKNRPWGGGVHFLSNLVDFLREKGHEIVFRLEKNIDIIFILSNSRVQYKKKTKGIFKYKKKNPHVKVLHRINVSDISKNTNNANKLVFKSNEIADETVFISNWLADYFIENGFNKPYQVIYNGCNPEYFYPEKDKKIGKKINLVTHHWSLNWMKGFDIYVELDKLLDSRDDITFTYIGRYNESYIPKNTQIIPPLYGKKLGDELRKYDIYTTAARWEGCGMHHIEGARCGLPVLYHRDGGGINESCKNYGIEYYNNYSLLEGINEIKNNYQEFRNNINYDFLSSKRCNEDYYKVILDLVENKG